MMMMMLCQGHSDILIKVLPFSQAKFWSIWHHLPLWKPWLLLKMLKNIVVKTRRFWSWNQILCSRILSFGLFWMKCFQNGHHERAEIVKHIYAYSCRVFQKSCILGIKCEESLQGHSEKAWFFKGRKCTFLGNIRFFLKIGSRIRLYVQCPRW